MKKSTVCVAGKKPYPPRSSRSDSCSIPARRNSDPTRLCELDTASSRACCSFCVRQARRAAATRLGRIAGSPSGNAARASRRASSSSDSAMSALCVTAAWCAMSTPSSVAKSPASMVASRRHIRAYAPTGREAPLRSPTPRATARHQSALVSSSGLNASACRSNAENNADRAGSGSGSRSRSRSAASLASASATLARPDALRGATSVPSVTCPQSSMLASCGVISVGFSSARRAAASRMAPRVAASGIVRSLAYDQTRLATCCHSTRTWPARARRFASPSPSPVFEVFEVFEDDGANPFVAVVPGPDPTCPPATSARIRLSIAAQARGDGGLPSVAHAQSVSETSIGDANGA